MHLPFLWNPYVRYRTLPASGRQGFDGRVEQRGSVFSQTKTKEVRAGGGNDCRPYLCRHRTETPALTLLENLYMPQIFF